jgi:hypothetical protein
MRTPQLSQGQIVPAAQPVDTFIRPLLQQTAAPAAPQALPNPQGIRLLGQGSGGSVEGSNQFAQLAAALAPFQRGTVGLVQAGLTSYATGEYERGQQEARRALVKSNQQMQKSGGEYATATRSMAQEDPQSAVLMDSANPYREAGRVNALSRIAAQEIGPAIRQAYADTPEAYLLKPGDPKLTEIRARATAAVLARYGLKGDTPGFADYVEPEIGQAWDRVVAQHWDDRKNYLKATVAPAAKAEFLGILTKARTDGAIQWQEFDPDTGKAISRTATSDQGEEFERGMAIKLRQVAGRMAAELGMPGETGKAQEDLFADLMAIAATTEDDQLTRIIQNPELLVGPEGARIPASIQYSTQFIDSRLKYGRAAAEERQREEEEGMQQFQGELMAEVGNMPDGPERLAALNKLVQRYASGDYGGPPLNAYALMKAGNDVAETGDDIAARGYGPEGEEAMAETLAGLDSLEGSAWDTQKARAAFKAKLKDLPPGEARTKALADYRDIERRKDAQRDDVPSHLVDPIISGKIKANIKAQYPGNTTEAALRGADIEDMLSFGDANIAASTERQLGAYRTHVYERLSTAQGAKSAKGLGKLTAAEISEVTRAAVNEYGQKDKAAFDFLFPGSAKTGTPGVGGAPAKAPGPGTPPVQAPPGQKPRPNLGHPSSQLDNLPDEQVRRGPVLNYSSTKTEVERVLNGRPPSDALSRAARRAGVSPGKFLLRQLDAFPSLKLPPPARQQLLRSSAGGKGVQDIAESITKAAPSAVAMAGRWLFDALTGTMPATAGTMAQIPQIAARRRPGQGAALPFGLSGSSRWGGGGRLERPSSTVFERPGPGNQPGVDFFFESKRFPALLPGRVKDIGREGGYGNFVVVESTDPLSGEKVDVLYAHIADNSIGVRRGQRIDAGRIIGKQGGTGNVRSADGTIASVDFLAPAPAGSRSMAPFRNYDRLRRHIARSLEQGKSLGAERSYGSYGGSRYGGSRYGGRMSGYLRRLSFLETRLRNVPNAEGSGARGYFQFMPATAKGARDVHGIPSVNFFSSSYRTAAKATERFIRAEFPAAYAAIQRGDYETADRILGRDQGWPSLPGGSQAQPDSIQRQAARFLR